MANEEPYAYCPDTENAHYGVGRVPKKITLLDYLNKLEPANTDGPIVKTLLPATSASIFFACQTYRNMYLRKPLFSNLGVTLIGTFGVFAASYYFQQKYNEYKIKEWSTYRHYIETHPENFPEFERKKFKDLTLLWRANR